MACIIALLALSSLPFPFKKKKDFFFALQSLQTAVGMNEWKQSLSSHPLPHPSVPEL